MKVYSDDKETDLGICVPKGNTFVLNTRIPIRQMKGSDLKFVLMAHENNANQNVIPVYTKSVFPRLDKLLSARFQQINGQRVIVIDPKEDQSGSGQNQEYQSKSERI